MIFGEESSVSFRLVTEEDCKNDKYCTLPLYDWRY